jgi:hypothetical protein
MPDDVLKLAESAIAEFKSKADHNKSESLFCFIVVVTFSLTSPLFVTLAEGVFWAKVFPSVLSLSVAASTAWLQLRKPQSLWSIYRDSQRQIEDGLCKYHYRLAEFDASEEERCRLLAEVVRAVAWDSHQKWLSLVPKSDAVGSDGKAQLSIGNGNTS